MKKIMLLLSMCFFVYVIKPQCSSSALTPNATQNCVNFSSYTSYSGSSPCTGSGFGGSGTVKVIPICTNSNNDCITITASGLPGNDGVSISLYSTCTGNPPTLGGYVSNSADCYPNATNLAWSTAGLGLSPNTCYYMSVWSKNGFPASSQFCAYTQTTIYDYCTTPAPLGTSPQAFNNYCNTTGSNGSYTEPPPSQFCASSLENNAWYTFTTSCSCTAPCQVTGTVSGITCYGGGAGFQLGFWTGSCSALSYIGCTNGSGGTVTFTINGLSPCQTVIMGMDGNAGAYCSYSITMSNVVPLPIELMEFHATKQANNTNLLKWTTATEKNNAYFTVEKSPDGINYHVLGKVPGAGDSYTQREYELIDQTPYDGLTYYQLSQTDYDGTTKHLGVVAVSNETELNDVQVQPNPTQDKVFITIPAYKDEVMQILISDITGKVIEQNDLSLKPGKNYFEINMSDIEKGVYFIHLSDRYNKKSFKVIKN